MNILRRFILFTYTFVMSEGNQIENFESILNTFSYSPLYLETNWKWFRILSQNFDPNLLKTYRSPVIQCVITDRFNNPFLFWHAKHIIFQRIENLFSLNFFSLSFSFLLTLSFQPWEPLTIFKWIKMFSFVLFVPSILTISFEHSLHIFIAPWLVGIQMRYYTHIHIYLTNNQPNRMDVTVNARLFNIA